jgi:uncharacterized protein YpmB
MKDRGPIVILTIGLVVVAIGTAFSVSNVINAADAVRDAAVEGCERQNDVRKAQRHALHNDIAEALAGIEEDKNIPQEFFPDIPPDEFERLIEQGAREARENIREDRKVIEEELQHVDCESKYPEP